MIDGPGAPRTIRPSGGPTALPPSIRWARIQSAVEVFAGARLTWVKDKSKDVPPELRYAVIP